MIIGILIAAAGKSERFQKAGGKGDKLNYLLEEQTVFEKTLKNSIGSGLPVYVVTRPDNAGVINTCLRFNIPFSLLKSNGLGESIALGVKNTSHWHGWLIQLADMPYINSNVFIQVANALRDWPLVRPIYRGIPGHPVGISAIYHQELINLSGDNGAKSILQHNFIYQLDASEHQVIQDIDVPIFDRK